MPEITPEQRKQLEDQQQKILDVEYQNLKAQEKYLKTPEQIEAEEQEKLRRYGSPTIQPTYSKQPPRLTPISKGPQGMPLGTIYSKLPPQVQQRLQQRTPVIPVRPTLPPISQPMRDRSTSPQPMLSGTTRPGQGAAGPQQLLQPQKKLGGR